jgi:hypothetical protein
MLAVEGVFGGIETDKGREEFRNEQRTYSTSIDPAEPQTTFKLSTSSSRDK